jgi:hypothetical protein
MEKVSLVRNALDGALFALQGAQVTLDEMVEWARADNPDRDLGDLADPESFLRNMTKIAGDDPDWDGDKVACGWPVDERRGPYHQRFCIYEPMVKKVVASAVKAMKAAASHEHELAWSYAANACYFSGILRAAWSLKKLAPNPAAEMAAKRHAPTYALADEALKHWRENIDPNLPASRAADQLLRVVPLSHQKLAELVSEEKKKLKLK